MNPLALTIILLAATSICAGAGPMDAAKFALHHKGTCDKCIPDYCGTNSPNATATPCSQYNTEWFQPIAVPATYLVLAHADSTTGVEAVQFGISIESESEFEFEDFGVVESWIGCGDEEMPHDSPAGYPWPRSGSSIRVTWDGMTNCQRTVIGDEGVHAIIGVFVMYPWDRPLLFSITGDSSLVEPALLVEDCSGAEVTITTKGGQVGYQRPGFNPCSEALPAARTTWGKIKSLYR